MPIIEGIRIQNYRVLRDVTLGTNLFEYGPVGSESFDLRLPL